MVSILIPTYNYLVTNLVNQLNSQLDNTAIVYEIIIWDDASTETIIKRKNQFINHFNVTYYENPSNLGRSLTRQHLAEKAKFDWLLFLDADVIPVNNNFIPNYLHAITANTSCIYGGIAYQPQKPSDKFILRWKFGRKREQISAEVRNKKPYKSIASGNLLIKKEIFITINSKLDKNWYGYDNFFSAKLKNLQQKILHINNPVYHLGLETNQQYLIKKEKAAETIFYLYQENHFNPNHDNGLLKAYEKLRRNRLLFVFNFIYKKSKPFIKKNLLSNHPSLFLLNIYRLGYFCSLFKKQYA